MKEQKLVIALKVCMASYLLTSNLYLGPSGLPQICDIFGIGSILLAIGVLLEIRLSLTKSKLIYVGLFGFSMYTLLVNSSKAIVLLEITIVKYSFFYIYNTMLLIAFGVAYQLSKDFKFIVIPIYLGIILQFFHLLISFGFYRYTGFMNNPNQLGLWCLCIAGMVTHLQRIGKIKNLLALVLIALLLLICLATIGKAALIGILFPLAISLYLAFKASYIMKVSISILSLMIILIIAVNSEDILIVSNLTDRLSRDVIGHDDSFAGRGYDRIYNHPQQLLFGNGEGGYSLLDSQIKLEIHSVPATILFCYGIPGLLLGIFTLYMIISGLNLLSLLLMGSILLYSLTHMSLRFSLMYLLIGCLINTSYD